MSKRVMFNKEVYNVQQQQFEIVMDGQRILVDQATQEVRMLNSAGEVTSTEKIQVAAGSVQGLLAPSESFLTSPDQHA